MSVLHHLAQAAAVILIVELLVVLFIFLGIAGGLAFGLHWVRGKTDWAFEKANGFLALVPKYTEVGTDLVAKPFILGGGARARLLVTALSIRRQIRENRARARSVRPVAVQTSADDTDTTVVVATLDETAVNPAVPEPTLRP